METISNNLKDNEVRVVRLSRKAIVEILWEYLLQAGWSIFHLGNEADDEDDNITFHMTYDDASLSELTFYVTKLRNSYGKLLPFSIIGEYLREKPISMIDSIYHDEMHDCIFETLYWEDGCKTDKTQDKPLS